MAASTSISEQLSTETSMKYELLEKNLKLFQNNVIAPFKEFELSVREILEEINDAIRQGKTFPYL